MCEGQRQEDVQEGVSMVRGECLLSLYFVMFSGEYTLLRRFFNYFKEKNTAEKNVCKETLGDPKENSSTLIVK